MLNSIAKIAMAEGCYGVGEENVRIIDYYSRFIEIAHLNHLTSDVITHCKSVLARQGIPELVVSNN